MGLLLAHGHLSPAPGALLMCLGHHEAVWDWFPFWRESRKDKQESHNRAMTVKTSLPTTSMGRTTTWRMKPASILATHAPKTRASRWRSCHPRRVDQWRRTAQAAPAQAMPPMNASTAGKEGAAL